MEFKKEYITIITRDPYYDLFSSGFINPEELLEDYREIMMVKDAMSIIEQFFSEAEEAGILKVG